jgi:hypothetical protein
MAILEGCPRLSRCGLWMRAMGSLEAVVPHVSTAEEAQIQSWFGILTFGRLCAFHDFVFLDHHIPAPAKTA